MLMITRNGKTRVYTGWREWAMLAAVFVVCWLVFASVAFVLLGVAATAVVMMLLVVPALVVIAVVRALLRR